MGIFSKAKDFTSDIQQLQQRLTLIEAKISNISSDVAKLTSDSLSVRGLVNRKLGGKLEEEQAKTKEQPKESTEPKALGADFMKDAF